MNSSRLPGKVMFPLDGHAALEHVITRTDNAKKVSNLVVATSTEAQDDVIAQFTPKFGADVIRGSESNVLSRFELAIQEYNPNFLVRITGDCPLIDPSIIDAVLETLHEEDADYASNTINRTFPRGLDVEAFTAESFEHVASNASTLKELEHVTPYYRDNPDEFNIVNIPSDRVYDEEKYIDRTDLRLTLDESEDYNLLQQIYEEVEYETILPIHDAIDFIDRKELAELNKSVQQKKI